MNIQWTISANNAYMHRLLNLVKSDGQFVSIYNALLPESTFYVELAKVSC